MVSLPELDSYSEKERVVFFQYSATLEHYFNLSRKPAKEFNDQIRAQKHDRWLQCAFAALSQKASTQEICQFWTEQTEEILKKVWKHCDLDKYVVSFLAFGKLGSRELNLSSDIDIVFVRGENEENLKLLKQIKKFIQILSENNTMGFCYRVDTSLRPGGDSSPLLPSQRQFFNYFDEYTEAWNRVSFVRMRPLMGPGQLNEEIRLYCQGLAFPRYLDFSVVEDIKNLRSKIQYQWKQGLKPLDIKFHPGGIRDIELYIQALQVIYGGKHPGLQNSSITLAMGELRKQAILDERQFGFFSKFYWQLRTFENWIHIDGDKHTYTMIPDQFFKKAPSIMDEKELLDSLVKSNGFINHFFVEGENHGDFDFDFKNLNEFSQKAVEEILKIQSQPLKKRKLENRKKRILNRFLEASHRIAIDGDLAIQSFRDFILAIRSRSSIFYLLDRHEELVENLAWLFSISPYIGQILCRRPGLVDSFALGHVEIHKGDNMETLIDDFIDYKLLGHLVSIIYFLKNDEIDTFTRQLSGHADVIASGFLKHLKNQFGEDLDILCMGKWSGFELGVHSDLDFVFLTDNIPNRGQVKIARRFINLITSMTKAGRLYNVDLRLKPNESAGPLLVSKQQLMDFLGASAQAWQKQAYLRSRILGQKRYYFQDRMERLALVDNDKKELEEIQRKLFSQTDFRFIDTKYSPGGLLHSEFTAQKLVLIQNTNPRGPDTCSLIESLELESEQMDSWVRHYQWLRKFEQILQICNHSPSTKVLKKKPNLWRVGRILKSEVSLKILEEALEKHSRFLKNLS